MEQTKEIYLRLNCHSENLGGKCNYDGNSRDSYRYTWSFDGFSTKKISRYHLPVKDFDKSKHMYAVYVVYTTGDSFGNDENGSIELIHITHDVLLAQKIKDFIVVDNKDNKDNKDSSDGCEKFGVDGVEFYTYPWKGYFESLGYVSLECGLAD